MRGLTCEDVSGGVGLRVTVPVTMGPDEAARELAPRLSALAGSGPRLRPTVSPRAHRTASRS